MKIAEEMEKVFNLKKSQICYVTLALTKKNTFELLFFNAMQLCDCSPLFDDKKIEKFYPPVTFFILSLF